MLATILKSKIATQVSIQIMDAFVAMRHYISDNLIEQKYINNQVLKNTEDIKLLQESFQKFEEKRKINEIYFDGQIFDAYFKIQEIFKSAKNELIIIDAYADNTILDKIEVYHCGASINRIGYKTFSITKIGDNDVCKLLIDKINKII